MQIDISHTPEQNLLALIIDSNPSTTIDEVDDFTVSDPVEMAPDAQLRNTTVTLTGRTDHHFTGTVDIHYRRLTLLQDAVTPVVSYDVDQGTNVYADEAALLAAIATGLDVRLDQIAYNVPGDILTRPSADAGPKSIFVQPIPASKLYAGDPVEITLNFNAQVFDFSTIAVTTLDGFDPAA